MAKIDLDGDGKADVSISITQIITIAAMFASIIGSYYTLSNRITIAEEEVSKLKYNQKEYTWKNQRQLEEEVKSMKLEMRDFMKDLEWIQKDKKR
tara:strand:+ start:346 stop:630 length:285 start_codon:yes stop_codon:yes gene_type:complete